MSLLSVTQAVCDIVGVPRPDIVADSATPDARQFLALANREAETLSKRTAWRSLTEEMEFLSVAQEEQTNASLVGIAWILNETFFNRSRQHRVFGPLSPEEWQRQKALTTNIGIDQYRLRGSAILLMPAPPAGETYAFEYVSGYMVRNADGDELKAEFSDDTDVFRISQRLLILGMVWRWKQTKGLDYAEDFRTYEIEVASLIARESTTRTLSAVNGGIPPGPQACYPEGSWAV